MIKIYELCDADKLNLIGDAIKCSEPKFLIKLEKYIDDYKKSQKKDNIKELINVVNEFIKLKTTFITENINIETYYQDEQLCILTMIRIMKRINKP
jgi:hypothetical protein